MFLPCCSSISMNTMISSCPFPDYILFPLRYPPSRPSPCLVFLKLSSSETSQTQQQKRQQYHNVMRQFLINKCGFSSAEIQAMVSKYPVLLRIKSTQTAQQTLDLFIRSGFTPYQLRQSIFHLPNILTQTHTSLEVKIDFFKTLGLEDDVGNIVSRQPRLLTCSLRQTLSPQIPVLLNIFGSTDNVSKAIKKAPSILFCENLENRIRVLERNGVREDEIKEILEKDPRFLVTSPQKLEKNLEFLTEVVGFKPSILVKYSKFLNFSLEKRLMPRYKMYKYLTQVLKSEDVTISLPTMITYSERQFVDRIVSGRPHLKMQYEKYMGKSVDLDISGGAV